MMELGRLFLQWHVTIVQLAIEVQPVLQRFQLLLLHLYALLARLNVLVA